MNPPVLRLLAAAGAALLLPAAFAATVAGVAMPPPFAPCPP
jgi:hypothetical protein